MTQSFLGNKAYMLFILVSSVLAHGCHIVSAQYIIFELNYQYKLERFLKNYLKNMFS